MSESFEISVDLPVGPEKIYQAWLDGSQHSALTGSMATCNPKVGGKFTASDGYIWGINLELQTNQRIVQAWRTSEFPVESPDSRLEIIFKPIKNGTRLILRHSNIPDGQGESYQQGWQDYYFDPLVAYFSETD
jgi:activator of HSP90 ATPase